MFYEGHTTLEIVGQLMVATLFLGTLAINATTKVKQHADRMAAMNIPMPYATLWAGFALQAVGGVMVAIDWHTDIGAAILILFTILASAIFHRFWTMDDPLRRHLHLSFVFSNIAVIGALLLLISH
ncbi:MAG: DoxX family protein [Alphaproteobacteria bacterium]|nr:DoxX family protein [Alphaproteobacteria bacterium]